MTRKLFGTDGVRGVANGDPMTEAMAMQLGRTIAHIFKEIKEKHRIVTGKDTAFRDICWRQLWPLASVPWERM